MQVAQESCSAKSEKCGGVQRARESGNKDERESGNASWEDTMAFLLYMYDTPSARRQLEMQRKRHEEEKNEKIRDWLACMAASDTD